MNVLDHVVFGFYIFWININEKEENTTKGGLILISSIETEEMIKQTATTENGDRRKQ